MNYKVLNIPHGFFHDDGGMPWWRNTIENL